MPAEHVPQVDFLQVMHTHFVAIRSSTFYTFSRGSKLTEEDWPQLFKLNLFHVQVFYRLKNDFPSRQIRSSGDYFHYLADVLLTYCSRLPQGSAFTHIL